MSLFLYSAREFQGFIEDSHLQSLEFCRMLVLRFPSMSRAKARSVHILKCFVYFPVLSKTILKLKQCTKIRSIFEREPTTIEKMIIGGLAGLIAQTITYPLEVTRRRMQTHGLVSENIAKDILSTTPSLADPLHPCPIKEESQIVLTKPSMTQTVRLIYLEQGIKGFFKGVTMNWVKGPIAFSISFTTYDAIKSWIEGIIDQERRVHKS